MILIAENLNSSIPFVEKALSEWDEATLIDLVKKLDESPADYLDLNAGTFLDQEASVLSRLIHLVRQHTQKPLVLDSPDPLVLSSVCRLAGEGLLLNSITLEPTRFSLMLELARETSAGLIALLMHEDRMPQGVDERLQIADRLLNKLSCAGIEPERIFLDPMIRPVSVDDQAGAEALKAICLLRRQFPEAHVVVGISNVSFGLPARRELNRAFLLQSVAMGLDCAILNPLDEELLALLRAGLVTTGQDPYCLSFLSHYR